MPWAKSLWGAVRRTPLVIVTVRMVAMELLLGVPEEIDELLGVILEAGWEEDITAEEMAEELEGHNAVRADTDRLPAGMVRMVVISRGLLRLAVMDVSQLTKQWPEGGVAVRLTWEPAANNPLDNPLPVIMPDSINREC